MKLAEQIRQRAERRAAPGDGDHRVQPERIAVELLVAHIPPSRDDDRGNDHQSALAGPSDDARAVNRTTPQRGQGQRQARQRQQPQRTQLRQARQADDAAQPQQQPRRRLTLDHANQQDQAQRGEEDHQVIVVNRGADEDKHRDEGIDRHRPCGDGRPVGEQPEREGVGAEDRPNAQQHGKEPDQVYGQRSVAPGKCLPFRVDEHICVVRGPRNAALSVRVANQERGHVAGVDPCCEQRGHGVVERRLAALLPPQRLLAGALDRQPAACRQMLDEGVVIVLVAGLEQRTRYAIDDAERHKKARDEQRGSMTTNDGHAASVQPDTAIIVLCAMMSNPS